VPPAAVPVQESDGEVGLIVPVVGFAAPRRQTDTAQAKLISKRTISNVERFVFMMFYD
jgi:hypothetical protein